MVTTGTSFPSGHAVAASVTVVAAVIALVPPGRRRAWWALAAMAFSILMGLSRAYLGAHWLSDAVAGILLGTSCALVTALVVGQIQRHAEGRQRTSMNTSQTQHGEQTCCRPGWARAGQGSVRRAAGCPRPVTAIRAMSSA